MKRMILICSMLLLGSIAQAQVAAMGHNSWDGGGSTKYQKSLMGPVNAFDGIEMSYSEGRVTFSGIPTTKRSPWVVVTNGDGEFIKQMRLTAEQNSMELKRLQTGLYFVTITYQGKSKKAFTINL